jgi:hypothetical protein
MPTHGLAHMLHPDVKRAEGTVAFTVTDTVVPALRILIQQAAAEVLELLDNESSFALDVAQEMLVTELANLLALDSLWSDEVIRPHQLTQEYARSWLISPSLLEELKKTSTPSTDENTPGEGDQS